MSNLKKSIEFLNLSYKKELFKIIGINVLMIAIIVPAYFFIKQLYIFIFFCLAAVFVDYFLISSYSSKKEAIKRAREDEFVSIISYFKIFISNQNNIYHSLECLIPYASTWMANEIQNLLNDIDLDKSVKPFISFANNFESSFVENVMLSIYQMVDEGENTNKLNQFTYTFESFSKEHMEHQIDSKQKSLDSINTFPLIGAGAITMVLMLSILTVIGDLTNVI